MHQMSAITMKSIRRRAGFANWQINLFIGGLFLIALAAAVWQSQRVNQIREAESFYRWILGESIRSRVFSEEAPNATPEEGQKKLMDRELFAETAAAADSFLSDIPLTDKDVDNQGKPLPRLSVLVRDNSGSRRLWELARGAELAQARQDYLNYRRDRRLMAVESQFDPNAVYSQGGANVSLGNVFFGFRKIAANFVWLQVDRFWHQGMSHRMLPLMHTCVALDPTFIDAYLLGAWHMAYNITAHMLDTPEPLKKWSPKYKVRLGEKENYYYLATDFLKDGIQKNPRDYRLYFDLGFGIYKQKLQNYPEAIRFLSEAIRHRHDKWVPRQLYQCYELNGQYDEALAGWESFLKIDPNSPVAPRFIKRNKGMIKEREYEKAKARANASQDPVEKEVLNKEAKALADEARAIWTDLAEPFAQARLLRMDALDCMEQGRFIEAIAYLDHARFESPGTIFDEASDLIIEAKTKANIPLSQSERMAVERKKEAEAFINSLPPDQRPPASKKAE